MADSVYLGLEFAKFKLVLQINTEVSLAPLIDVSGVRKLFPPFLTGSRPRFNASSRLQAIL